ncbi:MAG: ABC transporter ATP-binding protein [Candidatus Pelethousia sp.]|nr:ABC transporter ATP-binding protein [Candidatus Pelethousia sp.]
MSPGGRSWMPRPMTEEERQNQPRITKALLKRIFSYLLPYWPYMLLVGGAILFAALLDMLPAILTGQIIDKGFIGGDFRLLAMLIAASFGVLVASNLVGVLESYLNTYVSHHIVKDMRNQMYGHLQSLSHRFFVSSKQGEAITRMTSDIEGVAGVISGTLTNTLSNLAILLTSVIAMYQKNWLLATVGVVIVPLFILPTKNVGKRRWAFTAQSQAKNDEINQILNETLNVSGQQLVKLFTGEEREYARYAAANEDMFRLNIKEGMAGRWFRMTLGVFTKMGPMLIYLVGGILLLRLNWDNLTVGDITVMVALLTRMYKPVNSLLSVQVDFIRGMALFSRIFEYLDMPVEVQNKPGALRPANVAGMVRFDHVGFAYNPDTPILKDISFEVPAGKMLAIVGPSGAGKSTIISLITRLYDVNAGGITLDRVDVRDWDLTYLRQNIGVVTQESYLFNGTVRENLLYAKPEASDAELVHACTEANIHSFIQTLPQGYDTPVGNRGVKLSGGEKQRLAIARAILKDPRLLILDEATSSLDSISESLIQAAIGPLLAQRTSVVIAHRLSTVMAADAIIVVQDGAIVEQGDHRQLLAQGGVYAELYETQFRQVLDDAANSPDRAACEGAGFPSAC